MNPEFWLEGWMNGRTGFHSPKTNPFLLKFHDQLKLKSGNQVLVPLSGKTVDMLWLAQQGYPVLGVELSPLAAEAFFTEQALSPSVAPSGPFQAWQADNIELLVGDFFNLDRDRTKEVKAVYDRASLVALPPSMRSEYANKMADLLAPGVRTLLISFQYPQEAMSGPPHSVPPEEIETLYGRNFTITSLDKRDILEKAPRFKEAGLTFFEQHVYLLERV